jgi:hypothetical protein
VNSSFSSIDNGRCRGNGICRSSCRRISIHMGGTVSKYPGGGWVGKDETSTRNRRDDFSPGHCRFRNVSCVYQDRRLSNWVTTRDKMESSQCPS